MDRGEGRGGREREREHALSIVVARLANFTIDADKEIVRLSACFS
jgi:hypothetical protein